MCANRRSQFDDLLNTLSALPTHDEETVTFTDGTTVTRHVAWFPSSVDGDGTYHQPYDIVSYTIRDVRGSVTDVTQRFVSRSEDEPTRSTDA